MRRYHTELHITLRHWRDHLRFHQNSNIARGISPAGVACDCERQPGRFRKRDAYDCGLPRCGVCHPHKQLGHQPTRQERLSQQRMIEQLGEQ